MTDLRTEVQKLLDFYARRVWPWDIERELMPSMEALRAALPQPQADHFPDAGNPVAWLRVSNISGRPTGAFLTSELDRVMLRTERLVPMVIQQHAEPVIDCRTCRHYTTASGGCLSVIKCVDGVAYQRAGIRQYWRDGNLTG